MWVISVNLTINYMKVKIFWNFAFAVMLRMPQKSVSCNYEKGYCFASIVTK